MLHKPLTPGEQQFVKLFRVRDVSEDFIRNTCQPEYLKAKTPEAREFWSNQARKSKQNADRLLFNPETHCSERGEFLSQFGHCWKCQYPPMDPAQDAKPHQPHMATDFQPRVAAWMQETFGPEVSADFTERGFRFGEEAIELLQANGTTKEDVLKLVDYVYGRPIGKLSQEVGGTMVTLAALCQARGVDLMAVATQEQQRVEQPAVRAKIQAKQADKRARMIATPLPGAVPECNGQCGICSCISSPQPVATPAK